MRFITAFTAFLTRRYGSTTPYPSNRAAIAAYLQLKKLERWGGETPEEVAELAKKARFSQHTLTEEERTAAADAARAAARGLDRALPWWKRLVFRYVLGLY